MEPNDRWSRYRPPRPPPRTIKHWKLAEGLFLAGMILMILLLGAFLVASCMSSVVDRL